MTQGEKIDKILEQLSDIKIDTETTKVEMVSVKEHLSKVNGSVERHEKTLNDRAIMIQEFKNKMEVCETLPVRVEALENTDLKDRVTKKFVLKSFGIVFGLAGFIWAIVQILEHVF